MGRTNFGGIIKEVCLEYTPEVQVGDYVLVHVGFALNKVDEEEARKTLQLFEEMELLAELGVAEDEAGREPVAADAALSP